MKFRGTALLAVLTLLLGGFYFLYQLPRSEAKKAAAAFEKRFFRADTALISSIVIENRDGRVEISHGPGGWMIERPQRYRPDEGMIRKILATIAAGQLIKVVGEAAELPQFGFDQPVLSLTLGVGQNRDVLIIGRKNPSDTGYYAYSESLGKIFLVNKELPKDLYLRLYDLREKRLYPAVRAEDIGRIVINRGGKVLEVAFSQGGWRMGQPIAGPAAAEEVKAFLDALAGQKAEAFIPGEKKSMKALQQMSLQLFDLHGHAVVDSRIYYLGTGENEGVVVQTTGDAEGVRTGREFWETLQVEPTDFIERRLFPVETGDITGVSVVKAGERTILERQGKRWRKNGSPVDGEKIAVILDFLHNWKATKAAPEKEQGGKIGTVIEVRHALGVERLSLGEKGVAGLPAAGLPTMDIDSKRLEYFPAASSALNRQVLIGSHELDRLLRQLGQLK